MATHKSAEKRHRQSIRKRARNRLVRSTFRTATKQARQAVEAKEPSSEVLVRNAESLLTKAATKGVIKKKTASRRVSRLAKLAAKTK